MGMSQRDVDNFSLNALTSDVEAVVDALGVEVVDLLGIFGPGQEMVAFAARNPARVRRMVLWATPVDNSDIFSERVDAVLSLAQRDWDLFLETFAHNLVGWSRGQTGHEWAQLIRAAIAQPQFLRLFPELAKHDITPLLGRVQALTLVLHRPDVLAVAAEHARLIASAVPGAQIAQIEEGGFSPDESPSGTKLMLDFLEAGSDTQALEPRPSDTAIILFADITDSTALTERLGDAVFRDKARHLDGTLRDLIRQNGGTAIEGKLLGDGVLAVFTSARQAIEAALACGRAGGHAGLPLHLGLHAGDVIREENNVYGGAVNIASRISSLSAPGEVLVSDTVRSLARTSAGVRFEDRGEQTLKGVGEPVRVWAVQKEE